MCLNQALMQLHSKSGKYANMFMKKNCNHMSAVICSLINCIHLSNYNNNNSNSSWHEEWQERETAMENSCGLLRANPQHISKAIMFYGWREAIAESWLLQGSWFFIIRHIHNHTSIISSMSVMSVGWGRNARASNWGRLQQQPCQGHCRGARKRLNRA